MMHFLSAGMAVNWTMIWTGDSLKSMKFDLLEIAARVAIGYPPFLFALCFHEYAHGWVAKLRGDRTAERMGRLTMNPLSHIDPIGTFLFPLIGMATGVPLFGWAKPVPVDARNLKNPRTDMFWVALAGPGSNIFLGIIGSFILVLALKFFGSSTYFGAISELMQTFIAINFVFAIFNLIPIHPLDGGKVLERFISPALNSKLLEHQSMFNIILLVLFLTGFLSKFIFAPAQIASMFSIQLAERLLL